MFVSAPSPCVHTAAQSSSTVMAAPSVKDIQPLLVTWPPAFTVKLPYQELYSPFACTISLPPFSTVTVSGFRHASALTSSVPFITNDALHSILPPMVPVGGASFSPRIYSSSASVTPGAMVRVPYPSIPNVLPLGIVKSSVSVTSSFISTVTVLTFSCANAARIASLSNSVLT